MLVCLPKFPPTYTMSQYSAQRLCLLPNTIHSGRVGFPITPEARKIAQELLQEDRETNHCFFNEAGFHNHLSHHLLAVYDLGGSAPLIQAINEEEKQVLLPIDKNTELNGDKVVITVNNWLEHVGTSRLYSSYLEFFSAQIGQLGAAEVLNHYVFSEDAKRGKMVNRFLGLLEHPLIQVGYGSEFGSEAMVAQGLAQTAVHRETPGHDVLEPGEPTTALGTPLFELMKEFYESDVLKPLPYDPPTTAAKVDAIMSMGGGRPEKIRDLCAQWFPSGVLTETVINAKVEELYWLGTLLLVATSKRGHKTRLDFFIMHILTSTSFLSPVFKYMSSIDDKRRLLQSHLSLALIFVLFRGRPRIDCEAIMQYPLTPKFARDISNATDALAPAETNPWLDIIQEATHAKDAHTIKAVRSLYIAARQYGAREAGTLPGAGVLPGSEKLDGTLFVRAARLIVDIKGWLMMGDKEQRWDYSGLGWDEAWEGDVGVQSAGCEFL